MPMIVLKHRWDLQDKYARHVRLMSCSQFGRLLTSIPSSRLLVRLLSLVRPTPRYGTVVAEMRPTPLSNASSAYTR
jgi:hypothetical protein